MGSSVGLASIMRLTILRYAILCILHTPVSIVQAHCWEPGKSPYFTGPPVVEQVDLQTVRVFMARFS